MVDMWSHGCTFYEVLHLRPMFTGSQFILINRIANINLSKFEVACPEDFKKAILQCFEGRPDKRPTALEFMEIVERVKFDMRQSTTQRYVDYETATTVKFRPTDPEFTSLPS